MKCTIKSCTDASHWIVWTQGHPNGDRPRSPYCHKHAEGTVSLLWNDSPTPYSSHAEGPFKSIKEGQL